MKWRERRKKILNNNHSNGKCIYDQPGCLVVVARSRIKSHLLYCHHKQQKKTIEKNISIRQKKKQLLNSFGPKNTFPSIITSLSLNRSVFLFLFFWQKFPYSILIMIMWSSRFLSIVGYVIFIVIVDWKKQRFHKFSVQHRHHHCWVFVFCFLVPFYVNKFTLQTGGN